MIQIESQLYVLPTSAGIHLIPQGSYQ